MDQLPQLPPLSQIRDKAIELLARRDHSAAELERKLSVRGFPPEGIESVLARLKAEGIIDDSRFAKRWIEIRLRKHPEGPARLISGLRAKGIDREILEAALSRVLTEEILGEALRAASEKLSRKSGITEEKLIRSLLNRGFSYQEIVKHLRGKSFG